jgi:chromosome segregation ATPase
MVTTTLEPSQLTQECNKWVEQMHSYRDELQQLNKQLQQTASRPLTREDLTELEHFQNQIHIQLINVHDVKQEAKQLNKKVQYQLSTNSNLSDDLVHEYEKVADDYGTLDHTLQDLKTDFSRFVSHVN